MEYKVGDTVIHRAFGVGEIINLDERVIHEALTQCYVVHIEDLTVWVNADEAAASSIRPLTPVEEFEGLFAILGAPGEMLPSVWYDRKNSLLGRMVNGDLNSICRVIRDLSAFRREKKFNESDKHILEKAQKLLLSEWMQSLSVTFAQAKTEMLRLLEVQYM